MDKEWNGEICKQCGRSYRMGFDVPDEIWGKVTDNDTNCWCLDCFDARAKQQRIPYEADIFWAGYGTIIVKQKQKVQKEEK